MHVVQLRKFITIGADECLIFLVAALIYSDSERLTFHLELNEAFFDRYLAVSDNCVLSLQHRVFDLRTTERRFVHLFVLLQLINF